MMIFVQRVLPQHDMRVLPKGCRGLVLDVPQVVRSESEVRDAVDPLGRVL